MWVLGGDALPHFWLDEPQNLFCRRIYNVEQLLDVVADASDKRLSETARACLAALGVQLRTLKVQIVVAIALANKIARMIAKSKAVGALFGLTPKKYQSGEKDVTGGITRTGDEMVRTALYKLPMF